MTGSPFVAGTLTGKLEVEFTAGSWTDVTNSLLGGISIRRGRSDEFSLCQPGTCTFTLDNPSGNFSPEFPGSAYYPNVIENKRVRVSVTSTTTFNRFVGFIDSWDVTEDENTSVVSVTATDRFKLLANRSLPAFGSITPTLTASGTQVAAYFLLGGSKKIATGTSSGQYLTASNLNRASTPTLTVRGSTKGYTTNSTDAPPYMSTSMKLRAPSGNGPVLEVSPPINPGANSVLSCWFKNDGDTGSSNYLVSLTGPNSGALSVTTNGSGTMSYTVKADGGTTTSDTVTGTYNDGVWHLLTMAFTSTTVKAYLDGVLLSSKTVASPLTISGDSRLVFGGFRSNAGINTNVANWYLASVGAWSGTTLTADDAAAMYSLGWYGTLSGLPYDTTSDRVNYLLGTLAGLTSGTDYATDTITAHTVIGQDTDEKKLLEAIQEVAGTEVGAFFVDTAGKLQFLGRDHRQNGTSSFSLDAEADLQAPLEASRNDNQFVNTVTANGVAGSVTTYLASSVSSLGTIDTTVDTLSGTYIEVQSDATSRLSRLGSPALRVPKMNVDLLTCQGASVDKLLDVEIFDRFTLTNLPSRFAASELDHIVEGYTETIGADAYIIELDCSAADRPAAGIFDDATYGRFTSQDLTLTSAINDSTTSISVSSTSETFTTNSADYPITIMVDGEGMTVASPPSSSASPQSLTVTRGQVSTTARSHASAAAVTLWHDPTFAH